MTGIQTYASQAELAWAAYASLSIGNNSTSAYETAGEELVLAKAKTLSTRYTVQAIHNDPLTGAYAVVFKETATGAKTLAIRGTEGVGDVIAYKHLMVGIPAWMGLRYQSLVDKVAQWQVAGVINAQTTITGHSLGGYLADAPSNTCSARCRKWQPRRGESDKYYAFSSNQRPFTAGYRPKTPQKWPRAPL